MFVTRYCNLYAEWIFHHSRVIIGEVQVGLVMESLQEMEEEVVAERVAIQLLSLLGILLEFIQEVMVVLILVQEEDVPVVVAVQDTPEVTEEVV